MSCKSAGLFWELSLSIRIPRMLNIHINSCDVTYYRLGVSIGIVTNCRESGIGGTFFSATQIV